MFSKNKKTDSISSEKTKIYPNSIQGQVPRTLLFKKAMSKKTGRIEERPKSFDGSVLLEESNGEELQSEVSSFK